MTDRTIEISGFDAHLTARLKQIQIRREGEIVTTIPAEDIGILVVDTPNSNFTNETLVSIVRGGGLVILCGSDHLPAAYVVPVVGNSLQVQRQQQQLALSERRRNRLWSHIVRAKIQNQAVAVEDTTVRQRLEILAERVGYADRTNCEASAARIYWPTMVGDPNFRRERDGPPPNLFLNYGYTVLRAAVARALCAAGLNCAFGIHHSNRNAGFCLADDLMEPLRPWIDLAAVELYRKGLAELDKRTKAHLLGVLYQPAWFGEERSTVGNAIPRMVGTLVRYYEQATEEVTFPRLPEKEDRHMGSSASGCVPDANENEGP